MKRCSTLLITREVQIKTKISYHLTQVRIAIIKKSTIINAREGVKKKKSSYTVGRNVNWFSHYEEQYGGSLKNLKTDYHVILQSHSLACIQRKP